GSSSSDGTGGRRDEVCEMRPNRRDRFSGSLLAGLLAFFFFVAPGHSQQKDPAEGESEELVKATQNPVASLISVPIQDNVNANIGPTGRNQNVLNIQPVIPVQIGENWNLITRIITP